MRYKMLLVVVAALLSVRPMSAHHSWAGFDETPVTVEGRIEALKIANPHPLLTVLGDDERRYTVVWPAINVLARRGLTIDSLPALLKIGDRITVSGRVKREDSGVFMLPMEIQHPTHGQIWPRGQ